jgi:hypothetical protein
MIIKERKQNIMALETSVKFSSVRVHPNEIKGIGIRTTEELSTEITSGTRTFMQRGAWPMNVRQGSEVIVDSEQMRRGYVRLENLLDTEAASAQQFGQALLAVRFNVPMNLGAAWAEKGSWITHRQDMGRIVDADGKTIIPRFISVDTARSSLYASMGLQGPDAGIFGIATSLLGFDGQFQERAFISTTQDPRHIINLQYQFPPKTKGVVQTAEDFAGYENKENNVPLIALARSFEEQHPDHEALAKQYLDQYGWATYDRTVLAISQTHGEPVEIYKTYGATPQQIVDTVLKNTGLENPVIFGATEGGSFGSGYIFNGKIVEFGKVKDYTRGPEGVFALWMQVAPEVAQRIDLANSVIPK